MTTNATKPDRRFADDEARYRAVVRRDPRADGAFFYAVRTTGVYCRPVCPARRALRRNVTFYESCAVAEAAGYRPCRRCQPGGATTAERQAATVVRVCRMIEAASQPPTLDELAQAVGWSRFHLLRVFKAQTGITPKAYAAAVRGGRVRQLLAGEKSITAALHTAGYGGSGRFYATAGNLLGMRPSVYRSGGAGVTIRYAAADCWLGRVLVAVSERGVCEIALGDDDAVLTRELATRFPRARLVAGDRRMTRLVASVARYLAAPDGKFALPLDVRGTAFQQQVWQALRAIQPGETISYQQLAARLGMPRATRAVASACAANRLAVVVPCHRVVRSDGSISGYRWGPERKRALLAREKQQGRIKGATG